MLLWLGSVAAWGQLDADSRWQSCYTRLTSAAADNLAALSLFNVFFDAVDAWNRLFIANVAGALRAELSKVGFSVMRYHWVLDQMMS